MLKQIKSKRISGNENSTGMCYFSDFIFLQELIKIEIDIILGQVSDEQQAENTEENIFDQGLDFNPNKDPTKLINNKKRLNDLNNEMEKFFLEFNIDEHCEKSSLDDEERFGLKQFKPGHLKQYLKYLYGMHQELEMSDFYQAKKCYIEALTETVYVNHRIKKQTLERLININLKIGLPKDSPEKIMLSRYFIKQKYVQMLIDTSSFSNTKSLKQTMTLAKMLFNSLEMEDYFGLKILKNGFDSTKMEPELVHRGEIT